MCMNNLNGITVWSKKPRHISFNAITRLDERMLRQIVKDISGEEIAALETGEQTEETQIQ